MGKNNHNEKNYLRNMRFFLIPFIVLLCFYSKSYAEVVKNLDIKGNERISTETIKIYGKINLNENYNETDLNNVLKNLFETEFFEDVKVEIKNNTLFISVKEYPFINQIIILGEKSNNYKKQIKKVITLKEKRALIKSNVASDIEKLKSMYSSAGFNKAKINIKTKKVTDNSFDILIDIERGNKTKISSISFIGNKYISNRKLRDVVVSEEHKFWKILSRNTNFSENLLILDSRLLTNYYKSNGFYDIKINSKLAKINNFGQAQLVYSI